MQELGGLCFEADKTYFIYTVSLERTDGDLQLMPQWFANIMSCLLYNKQKIGHTVSCTERKLG